MNEIVNKFFLAGEKFMPEMLLGQPGYRYSSCVGYLQKKRKECENLKKQKIKDICIKTN